MLYLFAGTKRSTSVAATLEKFSHHYGESFTIEVEEWDICRGQEFDLLGEKVQEDLLRRIRGGEFSAVIMSPPCASWSRALWANRWGPRPLRTRVHPWGLPWLEGARLKKVADSNCMVRSCLQVLVVVEDMPYIAVLLEHPEDLGATRSRPSAFVRPASIWQLPELRRLVKGRIYTIVFYQCRLGARSRKPTRILSSLPMLASLGPSGWPHLSAHDGCHFRPFADAVRSHTGIIKRSSDDAFNTSQAAAYPPFMDTLIAKAIWAFCSTIASSQLLKRARDLGEGQDGQKKEEKDAEGLQEDGAHRGEESTEDTGAQGCQKKARQGEDAIEGQDDGGKESLKEKTEKDMRQLMEEEKKVQNAKDEDQEISLLVEEEIEKARRSAAFQLGRPFKLAPLKVHYKGKVRNFCDGLGKCSPGIRPAGSRGVKKT